MTAFGITEFPTRWKPPGTVLKGAELGFNAKTLAGVHGPTYRQNTVIWGPRGSGTSNLLRVYLANLVAADDVVVWMIDPEGQHAAEYLKPLLDGGTEQPAFDWVATTWTEAVELAHAAAEIATTRKQEQADERRANRSVISVFDPIGPAGPTQLIVVVASGAGDLALEGNTLPAHAEATRVRADLLTVARAGTSVDRNSGEPVNTNVILQLKRLTGLSDFRDYITKYVALNGADPADLEAAYGHVPDTGDRHDALISDAFGPVTRIRPYYLPVDRIAEIVRASDGRRRSLPDDEADQLAGGYLFRWTRTLKTLFGDKSVPDQFAQLGRPTMPTNLETATHRQLEHALNTSPSTDSEGGQAAATILANGCGQELLTNVRVQRCMVVEDGTLYVRWPRLLDVVRDCELRHSEAPRHPDAEILLRLVVHLATGGLTDASAILLSTTLDFTNYSDDPDDEAGEDQ
jgi:hypothetical protein